MEEEVLEEEWGRPWAEGEAKPRSQGWRQAMLCRKDLVE